MYIMYTNIHRYIPHRIYMCIHIYLLTYKKKNLNLTHR